MVHIMDLSAVKFMRIILPVYKSAVNSPQRLSNSNSPGECLNWPNRVGQLPQSFNSMR